MSRDIVDISTPSDRLVVASGIEDEPADQLAYLQVQHADVAVGDRALGVDLVVADAEVGVRPGLARGSGLDPGAVGPQGVRPPRALCGLFAL